MKISFRQNNNIINRNINKRINNYFYNFKDKIYNGEYMTKQIFDNYSELNNGSLYIRIRLCCFCNYFIIVNLEKGYPILFKDIIDKILIFLNNNKEHEKSIYCQYPIPVTLNDINSLKYYERYNQLETIL